MTLTGPDLVAEVADAHGDATQRAVGGLDGLGESVVVGLPLCTLAGLALHSLGCQLLAQFVGCAHEQIVRAG
jgi:hypothetical protein